MRDLVAERDGRADGLLATGGAVAARGGAVAVEAALDVLSVSGGHPRGSSAWSRRRVGGDALAGAPRRGRSLAVRGRPTTAQRISTEHPSSMPWKRETHAPDPASVGPPRFARRDAEVGGGRGPRERRLARARGGGRMRRSAVWRPSGRICPAIRTFGTAGVTGGAGTARSSSRGATSPRTRIARTGSRSTTTRSTGGSSGGSSRSALFAMVAEPLWSRLLTSLAARAPTRSAAAAALVRSRRTPSASRPPRGSAARPRRGRIATAWTSSRSSSSRGAPSEGGRRAVFEAAGSRGIRFVLTEPWTTLLLDDARVIHETTPIQPGA